VAVSRPEAERLRECRMIFERALADGVGMAEARQRIAADRWKASERRLAERRCGTAADADHHTGRAIQPGTTFRNPMLPAVKTAEERELQWWQK
jgi:hypothetical protein